MIKILLLLICDFGCVIDGNWSALVPVNAHFLFGFTNTICKKLRMRAKCLA